MAKREPPSTGKRAGRPRREAGPKMPYLEVDRLLVEGELVDGVRVWPSQRVLARRYDVAPSLVANFASQHECARRREEFKARGEAPASAPVVEPPAPPEPAQAEPKPRRKPGRPHKAEAPLIPFEELDRLLVFGEVKQLDDGSSTTVYPTHRVLAERYGVAPSVIASYAKSHNCTRRREEAVARISARADEKLIEARASALAVSKDDTVRMIDGYLLNYEKALLEGRVRFDNPTDFNTMVRLKEYVLGGPDSRQELHAALSLESLQQRHARMLRELNEATPELTGVVESERPAEPAQFSAGRSIDDPPPLTFEGAAQKPMADGKATVAANVGPRGANGGDP
jgi:hypothetical protein